MIKLEKTATYGWDRDAFKGSTYRRARDGWVLMIPEAIYLSK